MCGDQQQPPDDGQPGFHGLGCEPLRYEHCQNKHSKPESGHQGHVGLVMAPVTRQKGQQADQHQHQCQANMRLFLGYCENRNCGCQEGCCDAVKNAYEGPGDTRAVPFGRYRELGCAALHFAPPDFSMKIIVSR